MHSAGFFFVCPGFFPFDPFLYCLNPFVLHVSLRSMLPSLYNKHNTNIHAPGGIRTHDPSKRAAVDPRLRPRGHWDLVVTLTNFKMYYLCIKKLSVIDAGFANCMKQVNHILWVGR
jgi:hypothetical protein